MKKRAESRFPASLSRIFSLTLAVTMGLFLLVWLVFAAAGQKKEELPPPPGSVRPTEKERLTVLVLGRENEETPPDVLYLFGFLPDRGSIVLSAFPLDTVWKARGGQGTLLSAFRRGGSDYLRRQFSDYLGVPIDRTLVLTEAGLENLFLTAGPCPYQLTEDLSGTVHGREVSYARGPYSLDARTMADLLALPADSPAKKCDRAVSLLAALLQHHLPAVLTESGEELYRNLLTEGRTDLAVEDYTKRREAAQYLAMQEGWISLCYLDGTSGRDGFFLSEECLRCIRSAYGGEKTASPG